MGPTVRQQGLDGTTILEAWTGRRVCANKTAIVLLLAQMLLPLPQVIIGVPWLSVMPEWTD